MKDVFADRFLKCTASQGVVRLDFGRVENIDSDKNEISVAPSTRLVLPMDGFNHFVDQVIQLREQLVDRENNASQKSKDSEDSDLSLRDKKNTDSFH